MKFVSTRGQSPEIGFEDVLLSGPAPDGGLYVPQSWPKLDMLRLTGKKDLKYADLAATVLALYAGDPAWYEAIQHHARAAYAKFDDQRIAPLRELGPHRWLLELFHGPTLAFKDFALQVLAPLMNEALARRKTRALVLAATSGDTGAAAVAALAGQPNIDLIVLHPKGRISDIQRRQMTTSTASNVRNIAIEGTFDDAQALVKAVFADAEFAAKHKLAAINSINWIRIAAQAAYYLSTYLALRRPLTFSVPTGNFGDVFAGYVAKQMGTPIQKLIIATNANDILARALATGIYARKAVNATLSPAMDIQVASNFERLLFEAHGRDPAVLRDLMAQFAATGSMTIKPDALELMRKSFAADRVHEGETVATMKLVHRDSGILLDPHTAVGFTATRVAAPDEDVVTVATAHPAKFPEAVEMATGVKPALPERLRWILSAPERCDTLPNDPAALRHYIAAN
ncbi:MAG: threonine synthase [Alphaproteobacteria bacterium]|nr:threonine synthase [Alphaproteobacteria bacterium]